MCIKLRLSFFQLFLKNMHSENCDGHARAKVPDACPDFESQVASGSRPKLHSRVESLSMESLNKKPFREFRKSGHPKAWSRKFGQELRRSGHEIFRLSPLCNQTFASNFCYSRIFAIRGDYAFWVCPRCGATSKI